MNATNINHELEIIHETEEIDATDMDYDSEANGEQGNSHDPQNGMGNMPMHGYNSMPRPTKQEKMLNLMQTGQQSTYMEHIKPYLHVMMMQVSVKAGIKKYGQKGNDAIAKELQQLNDRKTMVPIRC